MRPLTLVTCLLSFSIGLSAALVPQKDVKPNVFILTDISNEPDDAESLVRLLLYSNELDIKGIVATTSYWLNYTIHDEDIYPILDAYEKVHDNLLTHSRDYPPVSYFRSIVSLGSKTYGLAALEHEPSEGALNLISVIDDTPLGETTYVLAWGGANVIAEALNQVTKTRSSEEVDEFVSKMLVYAISDQDNAGPWIRFHWPFLRYVVSIHGFNQYGHSAWVGMSGETYNFFDLGGPDTSLVDKAWVEKNVRSVGPLGAAYPEFMFIMEGDTPSTLFVLPNGLNDPEHPEFGGWGGRYTRSDLSGATHNHYGDAEDYAIGKDGKIHNSNKATIWRWREAYQGDFAARMQWTIKPFEETPHQPIVVANGTQSYKPFIINGTADSIIRLDISESYDLNGRPLTYKWMHYREISLTQGNLHEVSEIIITPVDKDGQGSIVEFQVPSFDEACHNLFKRPAPCKSYHLIAEVSNDAGVVAYRRFIIQVVPGEDDVYGEVKYEQNFGHVHDEL
ncbi:hypothetical protein BON22_4741 [Cyberlindnera fabianii]|uniref:DUF1593-domain-containing protein n=1 Tax=Cyberlindnera fabianii TaxID=36022 RepID=A0A1V2L0J3_CYBFA|nr:hypothetical protein BON22_4741 [Cyberlindnera fabianii]